MASQRISARSILREAFAVVGSLYVPLLIINSPSLIVAVLNLFGKQLGSVAIPLNIIYWLVAVPFLSGAMIFYTYQSLRGNRVTVGEAFGQANRRLLPLILAWIMFFLLFFAGSIALIIPGLYLVYRLMFSLYYTVIDNVSALDSVSNSWKLTKGRWWLLFRANFLIAIVVVVPIVAIALFIDPTGKSLESQLTSSLLGFLAGPLMNVNLVLLYRHLRDSAATVQDRS